MNGKRSAIIGAVALLFVVLMGFAYVRALRDPLPPSAPEPAAAADEATPPTAARRTTPPRRPSTTRRSPTRSAPPPRSYDRDEEPVEDDDPEAANVSGTVRDNRGRPMASVVVRYRADNRTRSTRTGKDGTFEFSVKAAAIRVWAERKDGALTARSEGFAIDGSEGGDWEVDLVLTSQKQAGLGIRVSGHEDGIFVRSVLEGTPAAKLGLMKGDVIIEVNGESVAGLAVSTITKRLTGPEGTSQRFTIRRLDGSEEELEFERNSLDTPQD